ncbi:MAG: hypothetical protein GXP31_11895 [Kiritimatiellaeota bacterium]|nr:hypothetical protein [Kiritimatiellota bacterium]
MPATVVPTGTTIYQPDKCFNGYSLILTPGTGGPDLALIDMNGRAAHRWELEKPRTRGGVPRARLLRDGRLLVLRAWGFGRGGSIEEYDWDNRRIWEYTPPEGLWPHHDVQKTADGNTLIVCRELAPERIRSRAKEPERRDRLFSDVVQEISPDGDVVWEWHMYDAIDIDRRVKVPASPQWWAGPENNTLVDWTHTNTVQALPENRWFDAGDERFRPGNIMVSLRQLDVVMIVSRQTKEVVWEYTGDYQGGLSGQHDSQMISKGIPGAGNILVFDNGASPTSDLAHAGCSFVLEVDPVSREAVWIYDRRERFHSQFTSSCQRLPNGNTLILEAAHGRFFEVTPEGETVWEHLFERSARIQRAYRYAYDHCPQTAVLPPPEERPVRPEDRLR